MKIVEIKKEVVQIVPSVSLEQKQTLDAVLKKVPTGGNSKPFIWAWDANELYVLHDENLAKHYLNRNFHTSQIAFGALIESIEIACETLNLKPRMQINENVLSLRISFISTETKKPLRFQFSDLLLRSTFRGSMQATHITPVLEKDTASISFVNQMPSHDFLNYLKVTANYIWHHQKATFDFFKEIRFFSKFKSVEMRGIPTSELLLPWKDLLALKLFSMMPKLLMHLMKIKAVEKIFFDNTQSLLKESGFVLICAPTTSALDLIQVGRRALRIWLDLECQGFQVQPLSTATLPIVDALNGVLPADTLPVFRDIYTQQARHLLNKEFNIVDSLTPVWLFRFGIKKGSHTKK